MTYPQHSGFIKLATGEYPRFEGDIRREHPEISDDQTWPNFPCPDTYAVVPWEAPPEHNLDTHCAVELPPVLVDGQWKMQWLVRPYTQEELDDLAAIANFQDVIDAPLNSENVVENLSPIPEVTIIPINP
jgi:hypothetical protein